MNDKQFNCTTIEYKDLKQSRGVSEVIWNTMNWVLKQMLSEDPERRISAEQIHRIFIIESGRHGLLKNQNLILCPVDPDQYEAITPDKLIGLGG